MARAWARAARLLRGAVGLGEVPSRSRRGSGAERGRSASGPAATGGRATPRERRQVVLRRRRNSSLCEDEAGLPEARPDAPGVSIPSLQDIALHVLAEEAAGALVAAAGGGDADEEACAGGGRDRGGSGARGAAQRKVARLKRLPADLLQRLLDAMLHRGLFEEACLSLFAGECLSSLSLGGYPGASSAWVGALATPGLLECDLSQCFEVCDQALIVLSARSPRLRRLRLNGCYCLTDVGLMRLTCLRSLVHLELEGLEGLGRGALAAVGGLSTLRSLSLRMSGARQLPSGELPSVPRGLGPCLDFLGCLRNLKVLRLGWATGVAGPHLAFLSRMFSLEELELCRTEVGDDAIEFLVPLADSLRKLNLAGSKITSTALLGVSKLTALEELDLGWCRVGEGVGHLRNLTRLRCLNLPCTRTTDGALTQLKDLGALESLNLDSCLISDGGLSVCQSLRQLRTLDISDTRVGNPGLEHLAALPQLRSLNLSFTLVTDQGMHSLKGLASLKRLTLDTRLFTDRGVASLRPLSGLTHLDLFGATISDRGARHLEAFQSLQSLEICGGCLTDVGVVHISRLPCLVHLSLAQNQCITDACLPHLSKLRKLRSLNLTHSRVSGGALQRYLKPLQELERLALYNCRVNESSLEQLASALPKLDSVGC